MKILHPWLVFLAQTETREGRALQIFGAGEVAQGAQAWQEKIRPAADRNKLRQPRHASAQSALPRQVEVSGHWAARDGLAIAEQRVVLPAHPDELAADDPSVLQELELA